MCDSNIVNMEDYNEFTLYNVENKLIIDYVLKNYHSDSIYLIVNYNFTNINSDYCEEYDDVFTFIISKNIKLFYIDTNCYKFQLVYCKSFATFLEGMMDNINIIDIFYIIISYIIKYIIM